MSVVRVRVIVHGRVQGVGYRESCRRAADLNRVKGWVRNCRDQTVEAVFEGDRDAVDAVLTWCQLGPPAARVDRIDLFDEPLEGERVFRVRDTC
jgi:acylphosphatase